MIRRAGLKKPTLIEGLIISLDVSHRTVLDAILHTTGAMANAPTQLTRQA
jgi:hypothetical protein